MTRIGKILSLKQTTETTADILDDITPVSFENALKGFKKIKGDDGYEYFTGDFNGKILEFFEAVDKNFGAHKNEKFIIEEAGLSISFVRESKTKFEIASYDIMECIQELAEFLDEMEDDSELKNFKFKTKPTKGVDTIVEIPLNVFKVSL